MVRKQVYIEARQDRALKREARTLGVPEAELVRRGIDALGRAGAAAPDPERWRSARQFIVRERRLAVPQTGRAWQREKLYEERTSTRPR